MTHSPFKIWRGHDWSTEGPDRAGGRAGGGPAHAVVRAALDADAHDEDSIAALGQRLGSGDFEGGRSGAVRVLGKLGFTVQAR